MLTLRKDAGLAYDGIQFDIMRLGVDLLDALHLIRQPNQNRLALVGCRGRGENHLFCVRNKKANVASADDERMKKNGDAIVIWIVISAR